LNASSTKPEEIGNAIKKLTDNGAGVDVALDALGSSSTSLAGLYSLRRGGRLSQVGLTSQEDKGNISVPMDMVVLNELQILGSFGNPQSGYAELFRLVASRRLRPTALVSREVSLEDVDSVLRDMDTFKTLGYVIVTRF
jgi:propanol-preferring alcohol dehydrogenase